MAIAFDANTRFPATNGVTTVDSTDTTTGDRTFDHAGSVDAKAAVVVVENRTVTTAVVTGVLYGGVAMTSVATSSDATEVGRVQIFVLIAAVPTGTQTVTLQGCTASAKWATCSTVTAARAVHFLDAKNKDTTVAANPSVTVTAGATTMVFGGYHAGNAAPATTGITGCTIQFQQDHGALCGGSFRTTDPTAASDFAVGATLGSDDHCVSAVALGEATTFPNNATLIDAFTYSNNPLPTASANYSQEPWNDGSGGGFAVVSNAIKQSTNASYETVWYNAVSYGPDCVAYLDITTVSAAANTGYNLFLRITTPSSSSSTGDGYYISQQQNSGGLSIYRMDNGVSTLLGATMPTIDLDNGDKFATVMTGSTLQAWRYIAYGSLGWAPYGSPRTDATYTARGFFGFGIYEDTVTSVLDNFSGGTIVRPKQARRSPHRPALATTGSYN